MNGWLFGWKDIANFVGCSVKTIQHYAADEELPVYKIKEEKPAAIKEELNKWLREKNRY